MSVAPERIASVFRKLERDLGKLSVRQTPASVHNFRTSVRRLQTLFELLLPDRNRNRKKLRKMLSRIRKRAGKVRDLDVQLAALRSLKVSHEPRRKTQLVQGLIELREEDEKRLRKALTKESVREIRKRLRRARKELRPEHLRDPLDIARKMLSQGARPDGNLTEEQLHGHRIITKQARYLAEFAPTSPEVQQLIAQLKRAQDALGDWHDWLTLTQTAARRLGDVHQSPLVAVLHNLTGAKFRKAVAALPVPSSAEATVKRASRQAVTQKTDAKPAVLTATSAA